MYSAKVNKKKGLHKPKSSDSIPYVIVAAGFNLRFSSFEGYMCIPRKLRNLKDAATQIVQFRIKICRIDTLFL